MNCKQYPAKVTAHFRTQGCDQYDKRKRTIQFSSRLDNFFFFIDMKGNKLQTDRVTDHHAELIEEIKELHGGRQRYNSTNL